MTKELTRILDANNTTVATISVLSDEALVSLSYITIRNIDRVRQALTDALGEPKVEQPSMVETIRQALISSTQTQADLLKLRSYKRTSYSLVAQITEDFMSNDHYDKSINQYLSNMIEDEKHNHISALSYILPKYSLTSKTAYFVEEAKLALSATIMDTYISIVGCRTEGKRKWVGTSKVFTEVQYVGDADKELIEKNQLEGLHFIPSQAPRAKRVKGKAGIVGKKLPAKFVTLCKEFASLPHRLVNDISDEDLLAYMMSGKEMLSLTSGKFLTKGRKYSKLERKALIAERVSDASARYKMYIDSLNTLRDGAALFQSPIFHSVHFEYRGRMNYDNTNMLLNPQSRIGKSMWEAFHPRVLNTLDYTQIVFSIVGGVQRVNPVDSVTMFEADEAKLISEYMQVSDLLELTYRKRVVQALDDYRTGTPNRTYMHRDYTNGGAIHFVSGLTREAKAMGITNLLDVTGVNDPHASLQKAFNEYTGLHATRDDIKKSVSQGITAGVSPKSAVSKIEKSFLVKHKKVVTISEKVYSKIVKDVYGKTGELFHKYNKWGNDLIDNEHSVLYFKTSDGFPSMSIAYIKSQEVNAYYVSASVREKVDLPLIKIHRNMPMHYIRSGKFVKANLRGSFAVEKVSGFLANVTHGALDAVANRRHMQTFVDLQAPGLLIHDNIVTSGMAQHAILKGAKQEVLNSFETLPFVDAAIQAAEGRRKFPVSEFVLSDKTTFAIGSNFLQC